MNKKKRFAASQAAHKRMSKKHYEDMRNGKDSAWILGAYHNLVRREQEKRHEILTREQREKIYQRALNDYWN